MTTNNRNENVSLSFLVANYRDTDEPVINAEIRTVPETRTIYTDSSGMVMLEDIPVVDYQVIVTHPEFLTNERTLRYSVLNDDIVSIHFMMKSRILDFDTFNNIEWDSDVAPYGFISTLSAGPEALYVTGNSYNPVIQIFNPGVDFVYFPESFTNRDQVFEKFNETAFYDGFLWGLFREEQTDEKKLAKIAIVPELSGYEIIKEYSLPEQLGDSEDKLGFCFFQGDVYWVERQVGDEIYKLRISEDRLIIDSILSNERITDPEDITSDGIDLWILCGPYEDFGHIKRLRLSDNTTRDTYPPDYIGEQIAANENYIYTYSSQSYLARYYISK